MFTKNFYKKAFKVHKCFEAISKDLKYGSEK